MSLKHGLLIASNVIARFPGVIAQPGGDTQQIEIEITPSNFELQGGSTLLGIQVLADEGSSLNPGAVEVRDAGNALVVPFLQQQDIANGNDSLFVAQLGIGHFNLLVGGENNSTGSFRLEVSFIGDMDENGQIARNDGEMIRALFGAKLGGDSYRVEADANLDGRLGAFDLRNSRDETVIRPLDVHLQLSIGSDFLDIQSPTVTDAEMIGSSAEFVGGFM